MPNRALHRTVHQRRCACWCPAGEGRRRWQTPNTPQSLVAAIAADGVLRASAYRRRSTWLGRTLLCIARLLREGQIHAAKVSYEHCRYTGPGSLSDVYAEDQRAFDRAWSLCASSIRALPESMSACKRTHRRACAKRGLTLRCTRSATAGFARLRTRVNSNVMPPIGRVGLTPDARFATMLPRCTSRS
jgi:hypothetical protein